MSALLLAEVRQFLDALETVQAELLRLFAEKQRALTQSDNQQLLDLASEETQAAQRLQGLLVQRNRMLEKARGQGLPFDSVSALVTAIGGEDMVALRTRCRRAEATAAQLRQESWVQWIISHRCYNHYSELLELIAHCGHRAPTYSDRPCLTTTGGAVLDASV